MLFSFFKLEKSLVIEPRLLPCRTILLGEVNGVNLLPQRVGVSVSRLIVVNLLIRLEGLESRRPDIVGWVGWVNNARTTWDHLRIVSTLIVFLPVDAAMQHYVEIKQSMSNKFYKSIILWQSLDNGL